MADLADALAKIVEEQSAPLRETAARFQRAVEAWVSAERAVIAAKAVRVLRPDFADPAADRNRDAAIAELRKIVAEIDPPVVPIKSPIIRRASTLDEQKAASVLLAEISRVSPHESHDRLVPRLRMLAATARELLEPLNPSNATYIEVFDALDRLRIVHRQSGMRERVCGLDFGEPPQPFGELRMAARRQLDRAVGRAADRDKPPRLHAPLALVAGKKR